MRDAARTLTGPVRRLAALALALALVATGCNSGGGAGKGTASSGVGGDDTPTTVAELAAGESATSPADTPAAPSPGGPAPRLPLDGRTNTTNSAPQPTTPTTTASTAPTGLPPEACPDATSCRRYAYKQGTAIRWHASGGKVTIPYWINAASCPLPADDMRRAIHDATIPWESAAPTVDFVFAGFTDRVAAPSDGHNDIGCTQANATNAAEANTQLGRDGWIKEADMTFAAYMTWAYVPCDQRDGSCTAARAPDPKSTTGCCATAMNSVATHELGHWLWLEDMRDPSDRELTMNPGNPSDNGSTDRFWSTLALGDVLGVRSLYPCSCPLPAIYTP